MKLKVKILKFLAGRPVCMIPEETAERMSLHVNERVLIKKRNLSLISVVDTIKKGMVGHSEIAVSDEIVKYFDLKNNENVDVHIVPPPKSITFIKHKLTGGILTTEQINEIVKNIAGNALTEVEIAFFVSAVYSKSMNLREIKDLTKAMVQNGETLNLKGEVVDKHSIGGIAGNRTTPIVVSICAAAGLIMPKTSSRAITSAAGTSDVIETIARVDFSIKEIKEIVKKTNACFVWGGALKLAPVDDKIIKIEKIANIDSVAQLLASILSKKISVGADYVLIDIPYGKSAKLGLIGARKLGNQFSSLSKLFNLKLEFVLTDGREPIGNGIGPVLEMTDVIKVLKRENGPKDLEDKAVMLAGKIFEMVKKSKKNKGEELARQILNSGDAFIKFEEIIKAQCGEIKELIPGKYSYNVHSERSINLKHFDNKLINSLAREAGCPEDKAAGIYLYKKAKEVVKKGEKILTIYATSEEKLKNAKAFYRKNKRKLIIS
ncbi:MAG: thymidine phosphorylase [Candidatus Pacearchaeota archaeon]|jgi:putative thymidine phosphorylase